MSQSRGRHGERETRRRFRRRLFSRRRRSRVPARALPLAMVRSHSRDERALSDDVAKGRGATLQRGQTVRRRPGLKRNGGCGGAGGGGKDGVRAGRAETSVVPLGRRRARAGTLAAVAPGGGSLATVVTAAVPLTAVVPSATLTLTLTVSIAAVVPTAALDLTAAVPGAPLALAPVAVSVFAARGRCRGLARAVSALEPSAVAILEPTAARVWKSPSICARRQTGFLIVDCTRTTGIISDWSPYDFVLVVMGSSKLGAAVQSHASARV